MAKSTTVTIRIRLRMRWLDALKMRLAGPRNIERWLMYQDKKSLRRMPKNRHKKKKRGT